VVDVDAPSSPTKQLQRQLGLYYRHVVNLNIFLADTLTLEQALTLNIACKCTAERHSKPHNPKTQNHFRVVLCASGACCDPSSLMS
jgi:hypothetical protein